MISNPGGLSTAQVQALIDAKGVVGKIAIVNNGVDPIGEITQFGAISAFVLEAAGDYSFSVTQPDEFYSISVDLLNPTGDPFSWVTTIKTGGALRISIFPTAATIASGTPANIGAASTLQITILR